jgi:hypothetical protein
MTYKEGSWKCIRTEKPVLYFIFLIAIVCIWLNEISIFDEANRL